MKAVTVLWRLVRRDFFDKVIPEHRLESNIKLFNYERCYPNNTGFLLTLWYVSRQNGDDLGLGLLCFYLSFLTNFLIESLFEGSDESYRSSPGTADV